MERFEHIPHPHIHERGKHVPRTHTTLHARGFNGWLAIKVTAVVSTMACAYSFAFLALVALPSALHAGTYYVVVWLSSTFLQLVFLPVLAVGQSILGKAGDERAISTYKDAEAILHESLELQEHLFTQDTQLENQDQHLREQDKQLGSLLERCESMLEHLEKNKL